MKVKPFDPPEGFDSGSIVTVTVGELRGALYGAFILGTEGCPPGDMEVEIGPCPWLGDDEIK